MADAESRLALVTITLLACLTAPEAAAQTVQPSPDMPPITAVLPDTLSARTTPRGDASLWLSIDDYPAVSLQAGEAGPVDVTLMVGAQGQVQWCHVERSSGFARLDAATCMLLKRRGRFTPATDRQGQPTADTYSYHFIWTPPLP